MGNELQSERVAAGRDTIRASVVGTVQSTVGCAGRGIGAETRVPGIAGVAVGGTRNLMCPTPVGVEGNRPGLGLAAATCCTCLNLE